MLITSTVNLQSLFFFSKNDFRKVQTSVFLNYVTVC